MAKNCMKTFGSKEIENMWNAIVDCSCGGGVRSRAMEKGYYRRYIIQQIMSSKSSLHMGLDPLHVGSQCEGPREHHYRH